jgi:hypothetical protein
MLSAIYEENCSNCRKDFECHLCRNSVCEFCAVQVDGEQCCRPCSVSIRNNEGLVSYFVDWHRKVNLGDISLTKYPELVQHKYKKGSTFSVAEFENNNILGSVTFRSDAQCDADAIVVSTEQPLFNEYRILVSEREIDEFLISVYASVQS